MKVTQYPALVEPLPNDPRPDLELDRWYAETQQPYPYPKSRHAEGTWVVGIPSFAENLTLDKWFPGIAQPYPYPPDPRARQTGAILLEQTGVVILSLEADLRSAVTVTRQDDLAMRSSIDVTRELESSIMRTSVDAEAGDSVPCIIDVVNSLLR